MPTQRDISKAVEVIKSIEFLTGKKFYIYQPDDPYGVPRVCLDLFSCDVDKEKLWKAFYQTGIDPNKFVNHLNLGLEQVLKECLAKLEDEVIKLIKTERIQALAERDSE